MQYNDDERYSTTGTIHTVLLSGFETSTAYQHKNRLKKIIVLCPNLTTEELRRYLSNVGNAYSFNNILKTLRVYFRDFKGDITPVRTFKFTKSKWTPSRLYTKKELTEFYGALGSKAEKPLFLLYASSGRRRREILDLTLDEIDLQQRVIKPNKDSATKHTWYSFYNHEAELALKEYLKERRDTRRSGRVFPMRAQEKGRVFKEASKITGLNITPQDLRFWFSCEMGRLKVADRFIDAMQGRCSRSVLTRPFSLPSSLPFIMCTGYISPCFV